MKERIISVFLQTINFIPPSICFFFAFCTVFTGRYIGLNKLFQYLGIYLLLIGLIGIIKALLLVELSESLHKILVYLLQLCSLSFLFPLVGIINQLSPDVLHRKCQYVFYAAHIILISITAMDLMLGKNLLVYYTTNIIYTRPFYRYIDIPIEITSILLLSSFFFAAFKKISGKEKKIAKIIALGLVIRLTFRLWDFINIMINKVIEKNIESISILNYGIFVFNLYIFVCIIQYIKLHIQSPAPPKENHIILNKTFSRYTYQKIVRLMDKDKIFIDPEISLDYVAKLVGENRVTVSKVINNIYGDNFNMFVNRFRVEEMKQRLIDPDNKMSIVDIGLESGFNSAASMHRVFFKFENMSPLLFRQRALKAIFEIKTTTTDESCNSFKMSQVQRK